MSGYLPWKQIPDLLLTVVFLCAFCYVLIYGKTCDWYASPAIWAGTAIGLCAFGALLLKEASARTGTYLDLHVFAYRNVWIGMLLFLVTVIANYGSTLMVSYIKAASAADNLHGATLSLWCVLGCVLGGALSVVMIVRRIPYKYIFATGLLLVCISNVYLYFQYQPQGVYEHMILPSVCNFAGMFMPYAVVCAYGMNRLPSWLLPTWLFLMIAVRNAVAPAISMSVYGNLMQERQQHYVTRFVQDVPSLAGAVTVKGQAAIVAMKDVTGRIVWFTGIVAVLALAYPRRWSMRS